MKKLLFPCEFVNNEGGAPQSITNMVNGLSRYDEFKVIVVCPRHSEMASFPFPKNVKVLTTKSAAWTTSKQSKFRTLGTIVDFVLTVFPYVDKDTCIISNQPVESFLASCIPFKRPKEIYVNRGGDFQDGGMASRFIVRKLRNSTLDCCVGISSRQTKLLEQMGMPKENVHLIHNGLPMPSFEYEAQELSKENLRISVMGSISDLKNQIEGVRLIRLLRDEGVNAYLNLYGIHRLEDDYQIKLEEEIEKSNLASYVNLRGFVSGEDLFADTDILISFSRTEGFGRSLVEGMLRKKPIIAWRGAGGPIDITADGRYGHLVDENEASSYRDVINALLNNPENNRRNVEDAYKYACDHFTVDSMTRKYMELIHKVCD